MAKVKRDGNILLSAKGEINLQTRTVRNKRAYTRKTKHKKDAYQRDITKCLFGERNHNWK